MWEYLSLLLNLKMKVNQIMTALEDLTAAVAPVEPAPEVPAA